VEPEKVALLFDEVPEGFDPDDLEARVAARLGADLDQEPYRTLADEVFDELLGADRLGLLAGAHSDGVAAADRRGEVARRSDVEAVRIELMAARRGSWLPMAGIHE
jgi:hypothetical protein